MAHRSNQAVASQEQPASLPEDPTPPPRRFLIGWTTALAALVTSSLVLGGVLWLARFPIAEFFLGAALAERGVEADFKIVSLDFQNATVRDVRVGPAAAPDVSIASVTAHWDWDGLAPIVRSVTLVRPELRLDLDRGGHVSAGALDHIKSAPGPSVRPSMPQMLLRIEDGIVRVRGPFGELAAALEADGTIGDDFTARVQLPSTNVTSGSYAINGAAGELTVASNENGAAFRLSADVDALQWNAARFDNFSLRAMGRAPLDLSHYGLEAAWRLGGADTSALQMDSSSGAVSIEAATRSDSMLPRLWRTEAHANAARFAAEDLSLQRARFDAHIDGDNLTGRGRWTIGADTFVGLSIVSTRPVAAGAINIDLAGAGALDGAGRITLAGSHLDSDGQRLVRDALPEMGGAPIGPTFAKARAALLAAGRHFDLGVGFTVQADARGARLVVTSPTELRAASGAVMQLKALRQDTPALTMQWPGAALHGAIELDLAGGGAPNAGLLLDSVDWAPDAPFDAQGTLSLTDWRTENASIATDELNVGVTVDPKGSGRVDLSGPARITGPIGDGEVRDLVANLDLGVIWNAGWRVVPAQHCLPVRLGGLDAAGLSFEAGRFSLCALNETLIAADASHRLSGGFRIQGLALDGHMSGPSAQPARLGASSVVGAFGGTTDAVRLNVTAAAPTIAVTMEEGRVLAVRGANLTANAQLGESWLVSGAFAQGRLDDPTLPGSVSAIEGHWSAAPEDGKPVIRVQAAQALLAALTPDSQEEQPLFHTLRITDLTGELRDGQIAARGDIVLEEGARQLAHFTAQHDVSAGAGRANILADNIIFGPALQPYDISELARGMVDNVRGPAAAEATISWDEQHLASSGALHLNGVSLSTGTIPIIQDVRGDIAFDDLFALTTPPHQRLHVGLINPGIAVNNGDIAFQLLPDQRVAIEQAVFDFASGKLSLQPTTIALGADETRFELALRDVDAAALISTLNVPDVTATGHVQGRFPLLLTRRSAFIQDGLLESQGDGGTISYLGHAGDGSVGMARVAFDALRDFRYDNLRLTLDGDLAGDIVSQIQFTGRNSGEPVDLGAIANVPGVGHVTVRGVPFDFHVNVTAPFRSLAETAATIADPIHLLHGQDAAQTPAPVDQTPQSPR
ncbi:MAG TPA: YdbH domain-containing protein [Vitreimonas sp.]|nr:YdbH domain-containing protein [Vitreimonas sp.]